MTTTSFFLKDSRNFGEKRDTFALQMALNPTKFGPNLRNVRQMRQMTQDDLAAQIEITTRQLQRWEAGESAPRAAKLRKILDVLEIDLGDLLQDEDDSGLPALTLSERLTVIESAVGRIENKLDAVLEIFTDAEALAAALDRRRADAPDEGADVAGLAPDPTDTRSASRPRARIRP